MEQEELEKKLHTPRNVAAAVAVYVVGRLVSKNSIPEESAGYLIKGLGFGLGAHTAYKAFDRYGDRIFQFKSLPAQSKTQEDINKTQKWLDSPDEK